MPYRTYTEKVRSSMERLQVKQAAYASLVGSTQASVSRWLSGVRPDPEFADAIDEIWSGLFPIESNAEFFRVGVAVMGKVGAGAEVLTEAEQIPEGGLFNAEFTIDQELIIAFEVTGQSMWPRYDDGDVLVCNKEGSQVPSDFIGKEVIVKLDDGRRFVKKLRRGSSPDRYTLESHNAPPIEDVAVRWLSEVTHVARRGQWGRSA